MSEQGGKTRTHQPPPSKATTRSLRGGPHDPNPILQPNPPQRACSWPSSRWSLGLPTSLCPRSARALPWTPSLTLSGSAAPSWISSRAPSRASPPSLVLSRWDVWARRLPLLPPVRYATPLATQHLPPNIPFNPPPLFKLLAKLCSEVVAVAVSECERLRATFRAQGLLPFFGHLLQVRLPPTIQQHHTCIRLPALTQPLHHTFSHWSSLPKYLLKPPPTHPSTTHPLFRREWTTSANKQCAACTLPAAPL